MNHIRLKRKRDNPQRHTDVPQSIPSPIMQRTSEDKFTRSGQAAVPQLYYHFVKLVVKAMVYSLEKLSPRTKLLYGRS